MANEKVIHRKPLLLAGFGKYPLYAAFDFGTAFAETILRDRPMQKGAASPMIELGELEARVVALLAGRERAEPLRLIKLYQEGLIAARTDNAISAIDDYPTTQRWAQAFHDHPLEADGLVYMSRYLGESRSVVLFDRCQESLQVARVTPVLEHPQLARILDLFGVAVTQRE
jgi:RES domain